MPVLLSCESIAKTYGSRALFANLSLGISDGERLGLVAGGSYDIAVDARAKRVFVGLNAGPTTDTPWGEVVLVEVDL